MSDQSQKTNLDSNQTTPLSQTVVMPWHSRFGNISQITSAVFAISATVLSALTYFNSPTYAENRTLNTRNEVLKAQNEQIESQIRLETDRLTNVERRIVHLRAQAWTTVCTTIDKDIPEELKMFGVIDTNAMVHLFMSIGQRIKHLSVLFLHIL